MKIIITEDDNQYNVTVKSAGQPNEHYVITHLSQLPFMLINHGWAIADEKIGDTVDEDAGETKEILHIQKQPFDPFGEEAEKLYQNHLNAIPPIELDGHDLSNTGN